MATVANVRYIYELRRRIRSLEEQVTELEQTLATLNENMTLCLCQNYHLARLVRAAKQGIECYEEMKAELEEENRKLRRQLSGEGMNPLNNVFSATHNAMNINPQAN